MRTKSIIELTYEQLKQSLELQIYLMSIKEREIFFKAILEIKRDYLRKEYNEGKNNG